MSITESSLISQQAVAAAEIAANQGSQRHTAMIGFVALSLLVTMSLGQLDSFQHGSLQYWLVVAPAVLLPLLDLRAIVATLLGRASLLLWFLLLAGGWHFFMGDARATAQLCALVLGMAWISSPRARISVHDLTRLYLVLVSVGLLVSLFTEFNRYGIVPGFSDPGYGLWRISFFPNIAYTGALSLVMVLVLTRTKAGFRQHPIVFAIASYFLAFSLVRGALVALLIYAALYRYFCRDQEVRPNQVFWIALIVAFGVPLAVFWSADLLGALQDNRVVSILFLRGKTNLSIDDILFQLYRPWLWATHLQLFLSSPAWMGWGSAEFYQSVLEAMGPPQTTTGSESLPTRLLASYGIPGVLFTLYLVRLLRASARKDDRWACACFPAVFFLMVNWGGIFHSTDGMFVLLLLMVTRGSAGFAGK
ncbi:hypothetical protein [Bradyrhizobium sp.]|uniref:hypothetical protein n=1 Tax=Bradyrhizobium sp. TaxID=376 RepID=UPI004037E342